MSEREIPEWAKKGVLIEKTNPQPLVRKNAETNREWEFQPVADKIYPKVEIIKQRLFDGVLTPDRNSPLPSPPVAIENLKYKTLATYRLIPDGYGMNDKLTLNAKHFVSEDGVWVWDWGGDWGLYETITHEVAHLKHKHRGKSKPDHGPEFRGILLDLGIFCTSSGAQWNEAEEGKPFAILMQEWGVKRPENTQELDEKSKVSYWEPEGERKKRGKSTLHPWICPECGQKLRATIKGDIDSTHDACGVKYIRADEVDRTIYKSK